MPTPDLDFQFAAFALTTPESAPLLEARRSEVLDAIAPETVLEQILADEIIHAGWEMERVRQLAHHRDADPLLAAANARASRNWHRARKHLKRLQRAQASQICARLSDEAQARIAACPLADLTRLPQPFFIEAPEVQ